ncbi:MAG TPA: choice-of-anchor tandem repeat GloVer-containing protein [Rhizomicrobium sp.]|jgi:uncharacterized repeat protein (TIGR03803 family)|nr:choice-of-anchor tandem repeat GloVer-containing protein [Rhizomicrobium sp.]
MSAQNKSLETLHVAALLGAAAIALLAASPSQGSSPKAGAKVNYRYDFATADSSQTAPGGALVQGANGKIYGEVNFNQPQIYEMSPGGKEKIVWNSGEGSGDSCYNGMTLGTDGMLYGTCVEWGYNDNASGIIFRFNPKKKQQGFTVLYTWPAFGNGGYEYPSPLTLGPDGNFYGTTRGDDTNLYGTIFKVTPQGTYTTLHIFQGSEQNDGAYPSIGGTEEFNPIPLTLGSDGNFYGTTDQGGVSGGTSSGTVYQVTPSGAVTILYDFPEGYGTYTGVVELNGNFYGQTSLGGTSGQGTIYELTADGSYTTLHSFSKTADSAAFPDFPFTIGNDGNLYNAAPDFESGGYGPESLYEITPSGTYSDLYDGFGVPVSCDPVANGCQENSGLLLHTNGKFYGVTMKGPNCAECGGTFFDMVVKQKPFVRLQLPVAKAGSWVGILGQGFAKVRDVSFNGTSTRFKIVSDTFMRAEVPAGAHTGRVVVTMPGHVLPSDMDFHPLR